MVAGDDVIDGEPIADGASLGCTSGHYDEHARQCKIANTSGLAIFPLLFSCGIDGMSQLMAVTRRHHLLRQ